MREPAIGATVAEMWAPDVRETGPVGQRMSSPALVGRAEELAALEAAVAAVPENGTATFLIGGDAGIGKTRLVEELCRRASAQGWLVGSGFCSPVDGQSRPYGPLVGILRELSTQAGAEALAPVSHALGLGSTWTAEEGVERSP